MVEELNDEIVKNIIKSKFKNQNVTELINNIVKAEESSLKIETTNLKIPVNSVLNTALAEAIMIESSINTIDNVNKEIIAIGNLFPKK